MWFTATNISINMAHARIFYLISHLSPTGDFPQSLKGRGEYYALKLEKSKILFHGCIFFKPMSFLLLGD